METSRLPSLTPQRHQGTQALTQPSPTAAGEGYRSSDRAASGGGPCGHGGDHDDRRQCGDRPADERERAAARSGAGRRQHGHVVYAAVVDVNVRVAFVLDEQVAVRIYPVRLGLAPGAVDL